jgi:glycine cleavage system H protein
VTKHAIHPRPDAQYHADHYWLQGNPAALRVGLTQRALAALGKTVALGFVPEGSSFQAGALLGWVETNKAVVDLRAPVAGMLLAVNRTLLGRPELLNAEPYARGFLCEIQSSQPQELSALLTAEAYVALH